MSVGIIASLNSSRSWHFLLSDLSFFSLSLSSQRTTPPCVTFLWVVGGGRTVVTLLLQVQFMNMLWHQTILYHLKHVPTMILKSVSISTVLMLTEVQNSATRKDCFINIHFHNIFTNKFFHLQLKSPEVHFYHTSKKCNCEPSAFIHIVYDLCHRGQLLSSRNGVFSDIKWNCVLRGSDPYRAFEGLRAEECGILNGCENGRCVRVQEGYTCDCFDGYTLDLSRMTCIGRRPNTHTA